MPPIKKTSSSKKVVKRQTPVKRKSVSAPKASVKSTPSFLKRNEKNLKRGALAGASLASLLLAAKLIKKENDNTVYGKKLPEAPSSRIKDFFNSLKKRFSKQEQTENKTGGLYMKKRK